MPCPSATLIAWTSAWLPGAVSPDDVLDALRPWAEVHEVVAADTETGTRLELPVAGACPAGPALLLAVLRRHGAADGRLVLPVPGDVRGLPGPGALTRAALAAGEAVVLPGAGLGIVPTPVVEGILRWTVHLVPRCDAHAVYPSLGEAEHHMAEAMRRAADTLTVLDVARHRRGVRAEIDAMLRARPRAPWPPGTPPRALRVLERADQLAAILAAAGGDPEGSAVSASAIRARGAALRPLDEAVRLARCAAVTEIVRVFGDRVDRR